MNFKHIDRKTSSNTDDMNKSDRRASIHVVQGSLGQAGSYNN